MDIKELRHMIKRSAAVLVLDNGEPSFVILDYNEYKKLSERKDPDSRSAGPHHHSAPRHRLDSREAELLEQLNKEILAIKSQIESEDKENDTDSDDDRNLRI